jgi:hypothetical protein
MSSYRPPSRSGTNSDELYGKVNLLCGLAADRLGDLLAELGVRTRREGKALIGQCPVHGGSRANAFNLYPDGHTARGIWFCNSKKCHEHFKKDLLGLTRGVLSRQRHGWESRGDQEVSWAEARDWLCQFVGQSWEGLRPDMQAAAKAQFVKSMGVFAPATGAQHGKPRPAEVAARLTIPSPYFLARGFRAETLAAFLVGEPKGDRPDSPMSGRAVAPVLCPAGKVVLGYSGRSLHERCELCGCWHGPGRCPDPDYRGAAGYAKWRHHGFERGGTLYGLHLAYQAIKDRDEVILTEGPGKVWRLHEAGYPHAVALFGAELADPQQAVLESLPCGRVTVLLDPNVAGRTGSESIRAKLGRAFRVRVVEPPDDPADMRANALKDFMEASRW